MPKKQIKSLYQRGGKFWLAVFGLLAAAVWLANFSLRPDFFSSDDAAVYADLARNILTGHGLVSNTLYPVFLVKMSPPLTIWPSLYPPFYPLILALGFLIFGASENSSAFVNGFFFLATIPFIYLLATKLFNKGVALLSLTWYVFNPSVLAFSVSGMTESLFAFLITSSAYLLFSVKNIFLFFVGLLIGFSYLTRLPGILLLPLAIGFLLFKKEKQIKGIIYVLIGFALPVIIANQWSPSTIWSNQSIQNSNIWDVLAVDSVFPSVGIYSVMEPITLDLLLTHLDLLLKKIIFNIYHFWQGLFTSTTPTVVVLYLLSFFLPLPKKSRRFRIFTLVILITFITFHLITIFDFRYILPLLPLILILSSAVFLAFLEKFASRRLLFSVFIFTVLFIVVPIFTSTGYGTSIQRSLAHPRKPTVLYLLAQIVSENTPPNAVIATDRPAHISWYTNRKSVLLPLQPTDLAKIEGKLPIDALFLSNYFPNHFPNWQNLVENPRDFGNFHYVKSFEIKPEDNYYRIPIKAVLYLKTFKK